MQENVIIDTATADFSKVQNGLDFILGHFSDLKFPRTISTASTQDRQKPVDYGDKAKLFYEDARRQDCRINAFRVGQTNPDLIFIDLDLADFRGRASLHKRALTNTLKTIES